MKRHDMPKRVIWVALCSLLLSPTAKAQDDEKGKLGTKAKEVLGKYCHECHHGPGSEGGEADFLNFKFLRDTGTTNDPWVVPGKPDDSPIHAQMLRGLTGPGMPPKKVTARPTAAEVDAIKAWIVAGCPDAGGAPAPPPRSPISTAAMLEAIEKDVRGTDREDRPYLRYFTLTHLHNADPKRVSDADLQLYRAAMCEAVNGLTWKMRIVHPRPVDPNRTIFAIDLRDLDWDRDDVWHQMLGFYPYGLSYKFVKGAAESEAFIVEETGCPLPYVRADWFAVNATRPPLYHCFLNLPDNAVDLEKRLGVNVGDNFKRNRLARGGMTESGVSKQHRLVERHDALYGAYWKSYDFKPKEDRADLRDFPLGPSEFADGYKNPYAARAGFQHDGGEMIFNLPNGMQAYFLVDGKDRRIDSGPIEVVRDVDEISGSPVIVNGLSCMACHKQGMKSFTDLIRDDTTQRNREARKVELLFPIKAKMDTYLSEDAERFKFAMQKAVGKYMPAGKVATKDAVAPVGWAAKRHREPFELTSAAAELGLSANTVLTGIGGQGLKDLNLGALAKENGKVRREDWESGAIQSAMQRLADKLRVGVPIVVPKK